MKEFAIVFKILRKISMALIANGIIALIVSALIIIYPRFLNLLVAIILLATAIIFFGLAHFIWKHSKLTIKL